MEPRGRGSWASERKRALSLTIADVHGVEDWRRRRLLVSTLSSRYLRATTKQKIVCILYVCRTHFFILSKARVINLLPSFDANPFHLHLPRPWRGGSFFFSLASRRRHRAVMATICRSLCSSCGKVLSSAGGSSEGTSKKCLPVFCTRRIAAPVEAPQVTKKKLVRHNHGD